MSQYNFEAKEKAMLTLPLEVLLEEYYNMGIEFSRDAAEEVCNRHAPLQVRWKRVQGVPTIAKVLATFRPGEEDCKHAFLAYYLVEMQHRIRCGTYQETASIDVPIITNTCDPGIA